MLRTIVLVIAILAAILAVYLWLSVR
jgi:hypothetical protein